MLTITHEVDKSEIERDSSENTLRYSLTVSNNQDCNQQGLDVIFAVDTSSSMKPEDISNTMDAINFVVSQYKTDQTQFGLITYADTATLMQQLTSDTDGMSDLLKQEFKSGFRTNISSALQITSEEFASSRNNSSAKDILILITDGTENTNGNPESLAFSLSQMNVEVIGVGLGTQADADLLEKLNARGESAFVGSSDQLFTTLEKIIGNLLGNSYDTNVTINLDDNLTYVDVANISQNGNLEGDEINWKLGTLGCKEKTFLSYSLQIKESTPDLTQIQTNAFVSNRFGDNVAAEPEPISIVRASALEIQVATSKQDISPGTDLTYSIDITNTGSSSSRISAVEFNYNDLYFTPIIEQNDNNTFIDGSKLIQTFPGGLTLGGINSTDTARSETVTVRGKLNDSIPLELADFKGNVVAYSEGSIVAESDFITALNYYPDLQTIISGTRTSDFSATFDIKIVNNGNRDANNVTIDLSNPLLPQVNVHVPDGVLQVESTDNSARYFLSNIAAGSEYSLPVEISVDNLQILNSFELRTDARSDEQDKDTSDNEGAFAFSPKSDELDISLTSSTSETVSTGDVISYTLIISNPHNFDIPNVEYLLTTPIGLGLETNSITIEETSVPADIETTETGFSISASKIPSHSELLLTFNQEVLDSISASNLQTTLSQIQGNGESFSELPVVASAEVSADAPLLFAQEQTVFNELPQTGSDSSLNIFNKTILGLLLALPLPILLLTRREKDDLSF